MKRTFAMIMLAVMLLTLVACGETAGSEATQNIPSDPLNNSSSEPQPNENGDDESAMTNITITVGNSDFTAKLYDNSATQALLAVLPMTLDMYDLNGNEKYYYLADNLPSESTEKPATMNAGELMCWSSNCLVLFYKTFSNSYGGYVRLGYVEDVSSFADALGSGNVKVTFAVSD